MKINIVSSLLVIQCLLIMNNMNYYQKHLSQIKDIKNRPTLLIHVCCGVCSVYPLLYLNKYFKVTVMYTNSNIYPYDEYNKRLEALETSINRFNKEIKLIIDNYDYNNYSLDLKPYKDLPEGNIRCKLCYEKRMDRSYEYACKHHYDYFTTVMSISNRKNANWINEIGEKLQIKYPSTKYLYADFKKDDGITLNDKLNKELDLYHQTYCGCEFSIR